MSFFGDFCFKRLAAVLRETASVGGWRWDSGVPEAERQRRAAGARDARPKQDRTCRTGCYGTERVLRVPDGVLNVVLRVLNVVLNVMEVMNVVFACKIGC